MSDTFDGYRQIHCDKTSYERGAIPSTPITPADSNSCLRDSVRFAEIPFRIGVGNISVYEATTLPTLFMTVRGETTKTPGETGAWGCS
jgi:hypothetical protein